MTSGLRTKKQEADADSCDELEKLVELKPNVADEAGAYNEQQGVEDMHEGNGEPYIPSGFTFIRA